jgi:hypothetical protein
MNTLARFALGIGAAAVIAGCGGSQPVGVPSGATASRGASRIAASPCRVHRNWYFRGACVSQTLSPSGSTFQLSAYDGFALTITIPPNDSNGSVTFEVSDATGNGDVSGKYFGHKFPLYGPKCYWDGGRSRKCPGKAFFYVHITGDNQQVIRLYGVPTAQLQSSAGFPGRTCFPAHIFMSGRIPEWWPDQGLAAQPNGNSLTLELSNADRYWGTRFHPYTHAVHAFACR